MTRDGALGLLMQMHDLVLVKPVGVEEQNAVFQGIRLLGIDLEYPPCACGGREPIEEAAGEVCMRGSRGYVGHYSLQPS